MPDPSELFAIALRHHQTGALEQAWDLYRQILVTDPKHADAWHLLGMIAHQTGQYELAVQCIGQAVASDSTNALYHCNLGAVHRAAGKAEEAIASYRRALALASDYAEAHNNLGVTLLEMGRHAEAMTCFQRALHLQPNHALAHNNLGNLFKKQGQLNRAAASYREALRLQPDLVLAHNNLGSALKDLGKLDEAQSCFREVVRVQPSVAEGHNNLGSILRLQGLLAEAEACHRQALQLRPDFAEAHNSLGMTLQEQHRLEEAVACFREALRLKPDYAGALTNLGEAFLELGNRVEGEACHRRALTYNPSLAEAHFNLGNALHYQCKLSESQACLREAIRLKPDFGAAQDNLLYYLNFDPSLEPAAIFAEHRRWGEAQQRLCPPPAPHANVPDPEKRLRIGYVSADFRWHAVTRFFEPILVHHDPVRIETYCYAEVQDPDATTVRLRTLAQNWRSTRGLTDSQVADMIHADGIDILVDLAGHSAGNRLRVFALKPAPVQVTYLGYPNTTGLSAIDYRLTNALLDPLGEPVHHTEELVRLPGTAWCFAPPAESPEVNSLPAFRTDRFTFGSLHNFAKLNEEVIDLWSRVLLAVPSGRLLLLRNSLRETYRDNLYCRFAAHGIPGERLDMRCQPDDRGYLFVYHEIDMVLDTFPWTGHVTSCESLWMGVPIATLHGNRHAARMTSALLTRVGMTEFIARSPEEFVARTARLAGALEYLAGVRSRLRTLLMTSLCDGRTFTADLEDAYRTIWRRWCDQQKPFTWK